jgi:hypothetical protein
VEDKKPWSKTITKAAALTRLYHEKVVRKEKIVRKQDRVWYGKLQILQDY